jgi:hypothetical protein
MASRLPVAFVLIALAACGKKGEDKPPPAPPAPPTRRPVAPPTPRMLPTFITLDEIRGHQPALTGVRMTTEVALDASGKQGIGKGCVTAAGSKVAMHQLADAFGVARWVIKNRATLDSDRRGEFTGTFALHDGTLSVRGVLAASPDCKPDEVGLTIYYSKIVDVPPVEPPPTGSPGDPHRVPGIPAGPP